MDSSSDAEVIGRSLGESHVPVKLHRDVTAQLKITVDNEGYLVADAPFREAVGPSFWERG